MTVKSSAKIGANYILAGFLVTILNGQNEAFDEK